MTQEEKQLLLTDLCARLPYRVKGLTNGRKVTIYSFDIGDLQNDLRTIKPYLRPMSSMTEEEKKEFHHVASLQRNYLGDDIFYTHWQIYDWLNKNYFDYRGLISKGLALEAPEEMYKN